MFNLPAVAQYRLDRAPLAQALAQVRYPIQARLGTLDGIALIQARLNAKYPYLESAGVRSGVEFQFNMAGEAAVNQIAAGQQFVFKSDDGHALWVTPDSMTLTVGQGYSGAADFKGRFSEVLDVLRSEVGIPRCDRIAARYLSLAETPLDDDRAWTRWFKPALTGWPGGDVLAEGAFVASAINQVQLSAKPEREMSIFPADVAGVVRHGLVPSGSQVSGMPPVNVAVPAYVIDMDLYCETGQAWDTVQLSTQFEALHSQIDRFFRWTLTDEGAKYFGIVEGGEQ